MNVMNVGFLARTAYRSCALALLTSLAWASGVRNVDQPALGIFFEVQDAIAAAADGDTLLVGEGDYAGFTLDGKALVIFGAPGQLVRIDSTVEVKNLTSSQRVVLAGLEVSGVTVHPTAKPALAVTNVAGHVRVQRCTLTGGDGAHHSTMDGHGGHGATITASGRVAFTHCILRGGAGHGESLGGHDTFGGNGGSGLQATGSSIAVYRCSLFGGDGGAQYTFAGHGGHGGFLTSSSLFASACVFEGADGGDSLDNFYIAYGGNGGSGLRLSNAASHAELSGVSLAGGSGGTAASGQHGAAGQPISGPGTSHVIAGPARSLSAARDVVSDQAALTLTVEGAPGDSVHIVLATRPGFLFIPGFTGPWLVRWPALVPIVPNGTIPASGVLGLSVPVPDLGPSTNHRIGYLQALCVSTTNGPVLTGSIAIEVIDPTQPPDCDASGANDYLESMLGLVVDCDHNLRPDSCDPDCDADGVVDGCELLTGAEADCNRNHVPDNCEIAAGTSFDCNANGALDECEIATGASQDHNLNGIPDDCESNTSWYVDASAVPGGNGSISSPFTTLAVAFFEAIDGDTIRMQDGLYTGPANRNLDFGSRELVVESVNGPANCILDAQLQGRLFVLLGPQTVASRIEGLTFRNGKPPAGSSSFGGAITSFQSFTMYAPGVTIQNCVFENCTADYGGAVRIGRDAVIEDCVFKDNGTAPPFVPIAGGAIHLNGGQVRISRCTFENNHAQRGGAIEAIQGVTAEVSHCVFVRNDASVRGGAIASTLPSGGTMDVDDCLFAGNTAASFGGVLFVDSGGSNYPSRARITQSTMTGNSAGSNGGAVRGDGWVDISIHNTVLWGNLASAGHEIALVTTSGQTSKIAVAYCDVEGGLAAVYKPVNGQILWGAGNLDIDPAFADPDGPDNSPLTFADNDYRLSLASPCIDSGNNASIPRDANDIDGDGNTLELTPLDLDLLPRRVDVPSVPDTGAGLAPLVDMGAYEKR